MPIIDIPVIEEFTQQKIQKFHTPYASKSLSLDHKSQNTFLEGWILDMLFNFVTIIITVFKEV